MRFSVLPLAFCLLLLTVAPAARADLMLYPTRLVFEKNQRSMQVDLINNGAEAAIYRISLVNRRMSDTGELREIDTPLPGELFATDMIQFSPRQVTLQPGTSQTVRVMIRKPAELAAGEYRSHLHFQRMPEARGASSVEAKPGDKEIGIVLTALVGASIPVIVRHEATSASVALSQLALEPGAGAAPPALSLQFDRSGNRSVYGDLAVSFTPRGGAEQVVARAAGVAVYSPNTLRRARLVLQPAPGTALAHGTLRVSYRDRPEAGGALLAEGELPVP